MDYHLAQNVILNLGEKLIFEIKLSMVPWWSQSWWANILSVILAQPDNNKKSFNLPFIQETHTNNADNVFGKLWAPFLSSRLFKALAEQSVLCQRSHSQLSTVLVFLTSASHAPWREGVSHLVPLKFEIGDNCSSRWSCYC